MSRNTLRLVIILAVFSIIGIATTQIYWVKKAFDLNEDQFNRDVNTALYNVASQLFEINDVEVPSLNPIEQLSTNYYVVTINNEINSNLLEFLLKTELKNRNIKADFEYGIYDCSSDKMVYGNYVSFVEGIETTEQKSTLPKWDKQQYYFGVYFPNKEFQVINRMGIWVFSTVVMVMVILFFAYTSMIILKQKRLSEIQKDFINNMTHEFKTPISTIAISAEVLKKPDIIKSPSRLLNYATIVQNEAKRLKKQVDRVLQMATVDHDEIVLKKESIDIHQLIENTMSTLSATLQKENGSISKSLKAIVPIVHMDKLHTTNVIYNMLDNAIKYCEQKPEILITTRDVKHGIEVDITDNGIGIEASVQKKVFDKFYRTPTGNIHNVKGFGLGLSYVKLVIKAHQGSISLTSELGAGSTFTIFIPQK